jgi:ribosomal protein L11 methyltransferase
MKKFFVYKIFAEPFNAEIISGLLWGFEPAGLVEEEDHIKIYIPEDSSVTKKAIEETFRKLISEELINSFVIEEEILEDKNWNEEWEKGREVIRISDRIIIKPSFKDYEPKENEIVLTIDPKMSFGTGEHQTTRLILGMLESYVKKGMKVLDVGSGTGILAIAAVKLGALRAVAVDCDEICLENCKENCELNSVTNSVEIITGEINAVNENDFDLILANIHKNVLLEIAGKIKAKIKKDGVVILSGLLETDINPIVKKYHQLGFNSIETGTMDEWISLAFRIEA